MTSNTFSIYFLLKAKNELANVYKLKKISSSKLKYYYFSRKLLLLK